LKIAKKLHKNPVQRLFKGRLEKDNPNVIRSKLETWERENTFSPQINHQSRSLTRTVDDLYYWNEQKQGRLQYKKQQQIEKEGKVKKVNICPGSATIIRNLDEIVDQ
jgi:hypothetical protein